MCECFKTKPRHFHIFEGKKITYTILGGRQLFEVDSYLLKFLRVKKSTKQRTIYQEVFPALVPHMQSNNVTVPNPG